MRTENPIRGIVEHNRPEFYDVVVVLGGNIRHDGFQYRSTDWTIGPEKSRGGHWRIKAAAVLVKQGLTHRLILSTGITHHAKRAPSEALVFHEELNRELAEDPDSYKYEVDKDEGSLSTIENARNVTLMLKQGKYRDVKTVGILTSSYHLARAREMFASEFRRQGLNKSIALISAERVLLKAEEERGQTHDILETIRRTYTDEEMQGSSGDGGRMGRERRGIKDFREGKYACLPPG